MADAEGLPEFAIIGCGSVSHLAATADFGAPSGFSECVAWILPLQGDAVFPHWSVTFAVDDTDAVAARARELGGTLLVEPYDIPPVRSAVIRDPQGAVFTASSFNPG